MPWIGLWAKVAVADCYVVYAGVKFDKSDHQHRVTMDKIGWVGMQVGNSQRNKLIKDVVVSDHTSIRKLAKTLRQLCKRPHYDRLHPLIVLLDNWNGRMMLDLNMEVFVIMKAILGLKAEVLVDLEDRSHLGKIEKLQAAVEQYGRLYNTEYFMGAGGLDYMGYNSLPGHEIFVQHMRAGVSPHSVVQLIASEKDPIKVIEDCSTWTSKSGDVHGMMNGVFV